MIKAVSYDRDETTHSPRLLCVTSGTPRSRTLEGVRLCFRGRRWKRPEDFLEMLPVSGFDGNILLRPIDGKADAPSLPDPDEGDDDGIMLNLLD